MDFSRSRSTLQNKSVYIIVLNYEGYQDTIECLESLINLDYPNYTVIVCDNNSPNNSEKYILEWEEQHRNELQFKFLQTGSNLGFAGGNNVGIRYALKCKADYIWLLNNDTTVEPSALTFMIEYMENMKEIGICGSRLLSYYNHKQEAGLGGWYNPILGTSGHILHENELKKLSYVIGASMLFRREVFEKIGLLQDDYFLYYEELDMAERIRGKYKMGISLDSVVYHKEGASIKNESSFSSFYLLKNNLKFTWRFYKKYFPLVFFYTILKIFHPIHKRPYRRVPMFIKVMKVFSQEIMSKDFNQIPRYN